jgi:hypothetical protein
VTISISGARTITTSDLARHLRLSADLIEEMLGESAADGIVVRTTDGSWRLSATAEQRYGPALRGMRNP